MPQPYLLQELQRACRPFAHFSELAERLVGELQRAQVVLLGEATHGTEEFYRARVALTRSLIERGMVGAVALESDWPDAFRVNRYVRGAGDDGSAEEALREYTRFPRWMWRNVVVLEFVEWLRTFNAQRPEEERTGIYGLDLYALYQSVDAVVRYLAGIDPDAAARAATRYGCYELYGKEPQNYGLASSFGVSRDCEEEAIAQVEELRRNAMRYLERRGHAGADEQFAAERNAVAVREGARYYRAMFSGEENTWNLRDRHMWDTLRSLLAFLERTQRRTRTVVVWAHNSHIGDAAATQHGQLGQLNLGQLAREALGEKAWLLGFSTYNGVVTAAANWGEEPQVWRVEDAIEGSYESLFHDLGKPSFLLPIRSNDTLRHALEGQRLQRAIGVIYLPHRERQSHYLYTDLRTQFDAVVHLDTTSAIMPLDHAQPAPPSESLVVEETYPSGL